MGCQPQLSDRCRNRRFLPHYVALVAWPILGVDHLKSDIAVLSVVEIVRIARESGGSGNRWPPGIDVFFIGAAAFARFSGTVGRVGSFGNPAPGSDKAN